MSRLEYEIRRRHVASMVKYLSEKREGLHVTDLVYGCPRYASYVVQARKNNIPRNIDEGGLLRLSMGKLLDTLVVGDWHHVDLAMGGKFVGQVDDIFYDRDDDALVIIDKKTVVEKPPREAHDHYIRQVQIYAYMLRNGEILGCEVGSVERLRELAASAKLKGAVLYVDVSVSTKTMVSDVKVFDIDDKSLETTGRFLAWMTEAIQSPRPEAVPSWFCHYCPIMNECWGGIDVE
ncbi:MAG: PD-(D/E)XK nuclease family protein [Candidatus Caldarchaeum sp.]